MDAHWVHWKEAQKCRAYDAQAEKHPYDTAGLQAEVRESRKRKRVPGPPSGPQMESLQSKYTKYDIKVTTPEM